MAAGNVTLLAFAADRRAAAAPLLLVAPAVQQSIDISAARRAHGSKPIARCCSGR